MYTYDDKVCELEVTSKYIGGKPMRGLPQNTNYHIVSIRNKKNHKVDAFEFWNSLVSMNRTKRVGYSQMRDVELHEDEQKDALSCVVSDALAGDLSIDDFASEFGYDGYKISEVIRIHNACRDAKERLMDLLDCDIDYLYDLANALNV